MISKPNSQQIFRIRVSNKNCSGNFSHWSSSIFFSYTNYKTYCLFTKTMCTRKTSKCMRYFGKGSIWTGRQGEFPIMSSIFLEGEHNRMSSGRWPCAGLIERRNWAGWAMSRGSGYLQVNPLMGWRKRVHERMEELSRKICIRYKKNYELVDRDIGEKLNFLVS